MKNSNNNKITKVPKNSITSENKIKNNINNISSTKPIDKCYVQSDCREVSDYYNIEYSDEIMINGKFYCPGKNQQCVIHCSTDTDCPSEKPICGKYLKNSENKICSVDISKIKDNTQGGLKSKQSGGSIRIDDTKGYYLGGTNEHKVSNISLSYKYTNFDIIYEEEIIDNKTENQIKQYCLNKLYDDYENKYDIIQYINQTTNKFIIKLYRLPFNMCIISRNIEETHITPTPSPTVTLTMNGGTTEDSTLSKFYKTLIRESIITDKNIKILDYETNNIINN